MRILLLSDIHANIDALEACLAAAPAHDLIVNLGDVVGYNGSPNEVCDRVRAMAGLIVRGNHDKACSGLMDLSEFNPVAAMSAYWTKEKLTPGNLAWLRSLPHGPLRREGTPGTEFVHGSPYDEDEYLLQPATADRNFRLPGHLNRIFFGHTHLQGGFIFQDESSRAFAPHYDKPEGAAHFTLQIEPNVRYLINPGSVGQPRDNDSRAAFALYENDSAGPASLTFHRVPYDIEAAQAKILAANLPQRLALRLKQGR